MKRLCIIASGLSTVWQLDARLGRIEASKAYTSNFFKAAIEYSNKFCNDYVILSPTLGILLPSEKIRIIKERRFYHAMRDKDFLKSVKKKIEELGIESFDEIIVLGGQEHYELIKRLLPGKKIVFPLRGIPFGTKIRYLKKCIRAGQPFVKI